MSRGSSGQPGVTPQHLEEARVDPVHCVSSTSGWDLGTQQAEGTFLSEGKPGTRQGTEGGSGKHKMGTQ